jgi:hypothetical protein
MKFTTLLLLGLLLFTLSGCDSVNKEDSTAKPASEAKKESAANAEPKQVADTRAQLSQPVSFKDADAANTSSLALERKIIRNANLTLEVNSPTDIQRKIVTIAETHQGFVVTSEATQRASTDTSKPAITVNLVVRVPAAQFNPAMEEIRAVGQRVIQEKNSGQDVTEEFMDLEARIKNQKALEQQFLEIMKRAGKVEDALSVQRELADVRTEIEKLEGRRRFLENQSSLSTINVTLEPPTQIVNASGFWYSVRSAFSDGVDAASAIVLFMIRVIVALLPIVILLVLPLGLVARLLQRRLRRSAGGGNVGAEAAG